MASVSTEDTYTKSIYKVESMACGVAYVFEKKIAFTNKIDL